MILPEHIAIILEKQLKGLHNSADTRVMEEWRAASNEHELLYQQVGKLWKESGKVLEEPMYDANKAWNKLDNALGHGNAGQHKKRTNMRLLLAACLTGVLVITSWIFFRKQEITIVASNGNMQLTLPDGSAVTLRNGSSISYPESFRHRSVTLTGEAFFDVRKKGDRRFRVQTTRATVEVLGTSFVISSTNQYDRLFVTTGKVAFSDKAVKDRHIVAANETAVLNNNKVDVTIIKDANYLSWQTGILKFDNARIDQVAQELSDYYNLHIQTDNTLTQQTITAKFDHQPVEQVLEEIKLLANISYRNQHDTIFLFKP